VAQKHESTRSVGPGGLEGWLKSAHVGFSKRSEIHGCGDCRARNMDVECAELEILWAALWLRVGILLREWVVSTDKLTVTSDGARRQTFSSQGALQNEM
jgi:hypothetical protein